VVVFPSKSGVALVHVLEVTHKLQPIVVRQHLIIIWLDLYVHQILGSYQIVEAVRGGQEL
jgi:hypothetical protein